MDQQAYDMQTVNWHYRFAEKTEESYTKDGEGSSHVDEVVLTRQKKLLFMQFKLMRRLFKQTLACIVCRLTKLRKDETKKRPAAGFMLICLIAPLKTI